MPTEGISGRTGTATTVDVRCTGRVRAAVGTDELEFAFDGDRLGEFLAAFADDYGLEELLVVDPTEEPDPMARLWARPPGEVPGWRPDAETERARPYGRVCVNGRFSYRLAGLETRVADGDRIALLYPFLFAP